MYLTIIPKLKQIVVFGCAEIVGKWLHNNYNFLIQTIHSYHKKDTDICMISAVLSWASSKAIRRKKATKLTISLSDGVGYLIRITFPS